MYKMIFTKKRMVVRTLFIIFIFVILYISASIFSYLLLYNFLTPFFTILILCATVVFSAFVFLISWQKKRYIFLLLLVAALAASVLSNSGIHFVDQVRIIAFLSTTKDNQSIIPWSGTSFYQNETEFYLISKIKSEDTENLIAGSAYFYLLNCEIKKRVTYSKHVIVEARC